MRFFGCINYRSENRASLYDVEEIFPSNQSNKIRFSQGFCVYETQTETALQNNFLSNHDLTSLDPHILKKIIKD